MIRPTTLLSRLSDRATGRTPAQPVATESRAGGIQPVAQPPSETALEIPQGPLPDGWLGSILAEGDNAPDKARKGQAGFIHVSSLIGFCSRQHAILRLHTDQPVVRGGITGGHRVMFALGRAAETHVRDSVISARRRDVLGQWSCACGHAKHSGYYPERSCPKCEKRLNRYGEMTLFDNEAKVVGNPDLLLREGRLIVPVEIKSMNKKEWDGLTGPKGDHVFQVVAYARMLKRLRYPVHDKAVIVYVAKDFVFGSPYKEFQVDTENAFLAEQWEQARQAAIEAHSAVETQVLPQRSLCQTHTSSLAKSCACVAQCFSRE